MSDNRVTRDTPMDRSTDATVYRYEIRATEEDAPDRLLVIGWSNDPDAWDAAVKMHPGLGERIVLDRHELCPETCNCPECSTQKIIHGDPSAPEPQGVIYPRKPKR